MTFSESPIKPFRLFEDDEREVERSRLKKILLGFFFSFFLLFPNMAYCDQYIIDDEVTTILTKWVNQFFKVGSLPLTYQPGIYVAIRPEINAGATVGGRILIYSGLIVHCQNAGQLLGVLAHEVGHIAGGHVPQIDAAMQKAILPGLAALALGGVAALATGDASGLMAGAMGGAQISERTLLKFSREKEASADSLGQSYLEELHIPLEGMVSFFEIIGKSSYSANGMDIYSVTHPFPADRARLIQESALKKGTLKGDIPRQYAYEFQRLKAKIEGLCEKLSVVLKKYPPSDHSYIACYARGIAYGQDKKTSKAEAELLSLLEQDKKDPYVLAYLGEMYFYSSQIPKAISYLEKAFNIKRDLVITRLLLAHAYIETNQKIKQAIEHLEYVKRKFPDLPITYRLLARAKGMQTGDSSSRNLTLADEALLNENKDMAKKHAKKASESKDRVIAQRAKDILSSLKDEGEK